MATESEARPRASLAPLQLPRPVSFRPDLAQLRLPSPPRSATRKIGGGDAWRLYELVTRRFLASVSPPCLLERTRVVLDCGGEKLSASGCQARP